MGILKKVAREVAFKDAEKGAKSEVLEFRDEFIGKTIPCCAIFEDLIDFLT